MAIARRLALAVLVAALSFPTAEVLAETTLRVFVGGQQRPDVMRPLLDLYQQRNPGVKVELEVGGATSELQQQYLTTVLTAQDSAIDVMLIDVVRPAQFAAAGWAEPLDQYLGADARGGAARLPAGLCRGEHGRRQADGHAGLRRRAVPLLPQGSPGEARPPAARDLGRADRAGEEDQGGRGQCRTSRG